MERKLRQVERMQASIGQWKLKISQNKVDCEERNAQLRIEKDHIAKHFQELRTKVYFKVKPKVELAFRRDIKSTVRKDTESTVAPIFRN